MSDDFTEIIEFVCHKAAKIRRVDFVKMRKCEKEIVI
jgi:hypothetical protein